MDPRALDNQPMMGAVSHSITYSGVSMSSAEDDDDVRYNDAPPAPMWATLLCDKQPLSIQCQICAAAPTLWAKIRMDPEREGEKLSPGELKLLQDAGQALTTEINILSESLTQLYGQIGDMRMDHKKEENTLKDVEPLATLEPSPMMQVFERRACVQRIQIASARSERYIVDQALTAYDNKMNKETDARLPAPTWQPLAAGPQFSASQWSLRQAPYLRDVKQD